ncbi:DNA-directed RNA polymerase subunit beta [Marinococcus luteus]|uniref:DNA-directed RNA polymerase subunit beta n=1 Tax=Marinococcus luteus TaxID=1122204 RepID=UPI002ACCE685|nr:DNA-directed RNA polymerase subunit beta [Marinococcus luteus]MDZ5782771.1 DNA-directed RNA polymerase subunit beta [Marinococcus luteus]
MNNQDNHTRTSKPNRKEQLKRGAQKVRARLQQLLWWHWLIIILVLAFVCSIIGLMIGYAVGGGNPFQALNPSTWLEIYRLTRGN